MNHILNVTAGTITAQQLYDWLKNKNIKTIVLENCEFSETIVISSAQLEKSQASGRYLIDKTLKCHKCKFQNADFGEAYFEAEVDFRATTFKHADFRGAQFGKNSYFSGAKFEQEVIFTKAQFKNAYFRETQFEKNAYFIMSRFEKNVYFMRAQFQNDADFRGAQFEKNADFNKCHFASPGDFREVRYWPDTISQSWRRWFLHFRSLWREAEDGSEQPRKVIKWLLPKTAPASKPQSPTEFFLESQNVDEVTNPMFKHYIADQQYIRAFKQTHPFWAKIWRWTSDYGRNLWLWAFESLVLAIIFGFIYRFGFPEGFIYTNERLGQKVGLLSCLYYSMVTFTTLGFGDIVASDSWARLVVAIEVALGYLMLGGLISIFANKLARRA
jgi:hypothetical protein